MTYYVLSWTLSLYTLLLLPETTITTRSQILVMFQYAACLDRTLQLSSAEQFITDGTSVSCQCSISLQIRRLGHKPINCMCRISLPEKDEPYNSANITRDSFGSVHEAGMIQKAHSPHTESQTRCLVDESPFWTRPVSEACE